MGHPFPRLKHAILSIVFGFGLFAVAQGADPIGKAIPLRLDPKFLASPSSIHQPYWTMAAFYGRQETEASCSVAAVSMIINTLLVRVKAPADLLRDPPLFEHDILHKVQSIEWQRNTRNDGDGVDLDMLEKYMKAALRVFELKDYHVRVVHTEDTSKKTAEALQSALQKLATGQALLAINFLQGVLTGDSEYGHFATIGAYDAINQRVLILDPDREAYEPYWVAFEDLLASLATKSHDAKEYRGYIIIERSDSRT